MSLFERLQDKRFNLQEKKVKKAFPSGSFDPANQEGKFVKNEAGKNLNQKKLNQEINKRLSASTTKGDQARSLYGTEGGSTEGSGGAATTTKPYKSPSKKKVKEIMDRSTLNKLKKGQMPSIESGSTKVTQSDVSKKAQDFTKKVNEKNPNRKEFKKFFDPEKAKESRKNLIAKRKEYGIDRKGNISDAGVERYAKKTKQLSSGSNIPAKITQADKDLAKKRMTDKYGRKLGRARNKNMPSYDQIKKDIELRPYKDKLKRQLKFDKKQQRTIQKKLRIDKAVARSGESAIKFRDTARSVASKIPGLSREVTLPAIGNQPGKKVKALKPIVKKVIQGVQKAGPGGAVVAGAGLALLNPSIRKTAKRVAKVALGAAGVKAFTSKPKLVKRPPSKIGINLSPKA